MHKNTRFKKKLIASAVASCVLTGFSGATLAQQEEPVYEEILVSGIRASLERAMDIKRDSPGVVDSISAEDIGKFPDTNLAESLQRVTGLSINRSDGEGSQVTARGIGAELNMVTLNGRVMPAVANSNTGDAATRAYDFANLASESVAGVDVYKTGRADVATGGLGATINIKTLRPLDAGNRFTVAAKAIQDTTARSAVREKITPEVSGMFSWVNDEDTLGVSLSGSFQRRDSANANNFVNEWQLRTWEADTPNDFHPAFDTEIVNPPAEGALYAMPSDLRYEVQDNRRDRTNVQGVVQFRPVENLTATVDYTYSELDRASQRHQQSIWFNIDAVTALTFDDGGVATPIIYQEAYYDHPGRDDYAKDVSFAGNMMDSLTQNNSFGLNLAYEVNDRLSFELDYHRSSADNRTNQTELGLNANIVATEYVDWSRKMPLMSVTIDDCEVRDRPPRDPYVNGNCNGVIDAGDMSGAMSNNLRSESRTEIDQIRLSGDFRFDGAGFFENAGLQFGIEQRKDENFSRAGDNRQGIGNWDGVDPELFPDQYFQSRDFGEDFPDYDSTTNDPRWFVGVEADLPKIIEVAEYLNSTGEHSEDFYGFVSGKFQWNGIYNVNRLIEEESTAAYVQFDSNFDIGAMNSNLVVGLRYEETDVYASSEVNPPEVLWWESDNDWSVQYASLTTDAEAEGSYDYFLPNIDFDIEVLQDVKLRVSYSETIGRPSYADLRPNVAIGDIRQRTASGGDPGLKPMESQNFDISAEWYYTSDSYMSLGYFRKDVDGFIGSAIFQENIYGLRDVRLGQIAQESGISQVNEAALFDYVQANTDPSNFHSNGRFIRAAENDPLIEWNVNRPVNDQKTVIDGLEAAIQHWFGDTGFGVQANYTMVDADVGFDNLATGGQFAVTGLSDTANVVAFYDKYDWQIRLAYNWRDSFLLSRTAGSANEPQYVEDYSQLDVSVGYEISDNFTFTLEGINVTGENYRTHGRSKAQLLSLEDLGARYQVGIRYAF